VIRRSVVSLRISSHPQLRASPALRSVDSTKNQPEVFSYFPFSRVICLEGRRLVASPLFLRGPAQKSERAGSFSPSRLAQTVLR